MSIALIAQINAQVGIGIRSSYSFQFTQESLEEGSLIQNNGQNIRKVAKSKLGQGANYSIYTDYLIDRSQLIKLEYQFLCSENSLLYYSDDITESLRKSYSSKLHLFKISYGLCKQKNKFNFIINTGLIVGIKCKIIYKDNLIFKTQTSFLESEFVDNILFGYFSQLGISYNLGKKSKYFIDLNFTFNNYSINPDRAHLTSYTLNEVDMLPLVPIVDKETIFKNSYTTNSNAPVDFNKPGVRARRPFIGSSFEIGIALGHRF